MLEVLESVIEEKNATIDKPQTIKNLKKIVETLIDENGWDTVVKATAEYLLSKKYDKLVVKIVLSTFHQYGDLDILFLVLIKYYVLDRENLEKLFSILDISDLEIVLKKSIELSYNNNYHILANNIVSYYDCDLECNLYLELLDYAKEFQTKTKVDCTSIISFLTFKKSQYLYASVPSWVSIEEGENLSLLLKVNPGDSYRDINSNIDKIVDKAKDYFYIDENEKEVSEETSQEINKALLSYLNASSLIESPEVSHKANRVFGPANRSIDKNCISNPGKDGPCRMLECLCLESEPDAPNEYKLCEWFTGKCGNFNCSKKIRDRSHAIRIPMDSGGWMGCFCCFECLNKSLIFKDKDTNFRIEAMKLSIYEDGIMDRTKT